MFFSVFFFVLFHFVASSSNQEDLYISNYFHIGCVTLNPDKQFISNGLQESSESPYQTFSSPNLTIDLCFRLCRQWIILMNNNHTNCICLYISNELYEINEHLGEVTSNTTCTTNALQIYSLTKDPYILPKQKSTDDWSFEGCYRLDGLKDKHANRTFSGQLFSRALILCRDHCEKNRTSNYSSFFLSFQKLCYCFPITVSSSVTRTVIRKPLVHCSFLPYVKKGFDNSFDITSVHVDTAVKINVQRYCSSSFVFNKTLYRCFKSISLNKADSYSYITTNEACSSVSIRTIEQYNSLLALLPPTPSRTFIWINRNSTYLFDELFKSKNSSSSSPSEDLCLVINVTQSSSPGIVSCSTAQSSDYIFCTQEPMTEINQSEFASIASVPVLNNIMCPAGFILFDNVCYYVDTTFVHNIQKGERVCSDKYENSSLVKFDSHQLGNANKIRFLGRTFDDILLEFFYYRLEKKIVNETNTTKHWLRLLVGDKNDGKICVLRYFTRSTGGFNVSTHCDQGGHAVCRSQPIFINENITNSSDIDIKPESITIETPYLIISNETADEDLDKNGANVDYSNSTSKAKPKPDVKHKSRLTYAILSLLTLIALGSTIFLLYHFRQEPGWNWNQDPRRRYNSRRKSPSTSSIRNETSNTPTVVYSRLPPSPADLDMINAFDNTVVIDDQIHLLPESEQSANFPVNPMAETNA